MMELNDFRKQLDLATQCIPRKHPDAIRALSKEYTHSISLRCNPNIMDSTSDCFLFVFEEYVPEQLVGKISAFSQKASEKSNVFQVLLDNGFIELHDERKADDKILSKWGVGLIWEHPVFEVPSSYGNEVKYSSGRPEVEVLEKLLSGS